MLRAGLQAGSWSAKRCANFRMADQLRGEIRRPSGRKVRPRTDFGNDVELNLEVPAKTQPERFLNWGFTKTTARPARAPEKTLAFTKEFQGQDRHKTDALDTLPH
jgi:hypothetical protein